MVTATTLDAPATRRVMTFAWLESQRLGSSTIAPEHLLLGLVDDIDSVAVAVLASLRIPLVKIRDDIEFIIGPAEPLRTERSLYSLRVRKVLALAEEEANRRGAETVLPEDILLGLVREGEGIAAGLLESLGVSEQWIRHTLARL